jgi:hypothetical protein
LLPDSGHGVQFLLWTVREKGTVAVMKCVRAVGMAAEGSSSSPGRRDRLWGRPNLLWNEYRG